MKPSIDTLRAIAKRCRISILEMITTAGSGHPGGSLSAIDLLVVLYFHTLHHSPKNPAWADRDRFVLSKGHGVPALYAVLAESRYFEKEQLNTLRQLNSPLQGHPVYGTLPGVEASTGSLGQGLSVAVGMALTAKIDRASWRVYVLLGDGECEAGQVWEAAMSASKFGLDNLVVFIDYNKYQIDGAIEEIMPLEPLAEKWRSFNWEVEEIDGHDFTQIIGALEREPMGKPRMLIAHTQKGKGISFMEKEPMMWHGKAPSREQLERALKELQNG